MKSTKTTTRQLSATTDDGIAAIIDAEGEITAPTAEDEAMTVHVDLLVAYMRELYAEARAKADEARDAFYADEIGISAYFERDAHSAGACETLAKLIGYCGATLEA